MGLWGRRKSSGGSREKRLWGKYGSTSEGLGKSGWATHINVHAQRCHLTLEMLSWDVYNLPFRPAVIWMYVSECVCVCVCVCVVCMRQLLSKPYGHVCAQSLSCVWLFLTPRSEACHAPLSMEFPRQEYWSGLPLPSPGDLPDPGIEPVSPVSAALAGGFFTTGSPGKPYGHIICIIPPPRPHTVRVWWDHITWFAEVEIRMPPWLTRLSKMVGHTEESDVSHSPE